jgi:hypothetical protein
MNLEDLFDLLDRARGLNGGALVAKTPHGTHTFAVDDVEVGLNTGDVVLRLRPLAEGS